MVAGHRAGDHHRHGRASRFDWVAAVARRARPVDGQRRDVWHQRIDEAAGHDPADFHSNNGWVVAALQAAAGGDHHRGGRRRTTAPVDHLAAALRRAARSGGDTDTVAAIAGALLGARWGATAVPLGGAAVLHGRRIYGEPVLRCRDLDTLARLAVSGGRPDARGWPGGAEHGPDYVERFGLTPLASEIDGAWFGNVGGIPISRRRRRHGRRVAVPHGHRRRPRPAEHHTVGLIDSTAADNPNAGVRPRRHRPHGAGPGRCRRAGVRALCGE